jgi:uncharacterized membrane protein
MGTLPLVDMACLAVFVLTWLSYGYAVHRFSPGSINARLGGLRVAWMRTLLRRDNRIVDSGLLGHVVNSASFFASASLIVIGALVSLLSNVDHLQPAIEGLAFVAPVSRRLFEIKVVLPLVVMVYGFVQFTWAIRQLNYTIVLIGAAPDYRSVGAFRERLAQAIGGVMTAALYSFNSGLRSYYYAIASLTWLAAPWAMALTAVMLTGLLVWRQIASPTARLFQEALAATDAAHEALQDE